MWAFHYNIDEVNNMIRVFDETDKVFTTNGNAVIQPLKAKLHKKIMAIII
jgi:hypothetical protein